MLGIQNEYQLAPLISLTDTELTRLGSRLLHAKDWWVRSVCCSAMREEMTAGFPGLHHWAISAASSSTASLTAVSVRMP